MAQGPTEERLVSFGDVADLAEEVAITVRDKFRAFKSEDEIKAELVRFFSAFFASANGEFSIDWGADLDGPPAIKQDGSIAICHTFGHSHLFSCVILDKVVAETVEDAVADRGSVEDGILMCGQIEAVLKRAQEVLQTRRAALLAEADRPSTM